MSAAATLAEADAMRQAGRLRDAAGLYESLLGSPYTAQAQLGLGAVYLGAHQLEHAEAQLRRAFADARLEPETLYLLGQVEEARGNPHGAVARYRQCIAIAPMHSAAGERLRALDGGAPGPHASPTRPAIRPVYAKSLIGTVLSCGVRRENYLGMVNALTVVTLNVQPLDGGPNASITIAGTKLTGAPPEKGHVVELDLDSAKDRGLSTFETKTLFNHTAGGEIAARKSMLGR